MTIQEKPANLAGPIAPAVHDLIDCVQENFKPIHPGAFRLFMAQLQEICKRYDNKEYDVLVSRVEAFLRGRPGWEKEEDSYLIEKMYAYLQENPYSEKMQELIQDAVLENIVHQFQEDYLGTVVTAINEKLPRGFMFQQDTTRTISWKLYCLDSREIPFDLFVSRQHNDASWLSFHPMLKEGVTASDLSEEERALYGQCLSLSRLTYDVSTNSPRAQDFQQIVIDSVWELSGLVRDTDDREWE